jgi:formylglycine-generating enzyme required for sulfatase activity
MSIQNPEQRMRFAIITVLFAMAAGALAQDIKLVRIEPGEFEMGNPSAGQRREELPVRKVKITRPFSIGATEVTRGQWKALMGDLPAEAPAGLRDDHPVTGVDWYDAVEFCRKLSAKGEAVYRLPTEAEWEYACGKGADDIYSRPLPRRNVSPDPDKGPKSMRAAAEGKPDPRGLHNMRGNAFEWCYDYFDGEWHARSALDRVIPAAEKPHGMIRMTSSESQRRQSDRLSKGVAEPFVDPVNAVRGNAGQRAVRGGCWLSATEECSPTARAGADPLWRSRAIGFRVVREEGAGPTLKYPQRPGEVEVAGAGRLPSVVVNRAGMRFVLCGPGTFVAGMTPEQAELAEQGAANSQAGQVKVTLTRPFYVVAVQFHRVFDDGGSVRDWPGGYDSLYPITQPWYLAMDHLLRVSEADGRILRLPTLVEYEYASRAGTNTTWHWGDDFASAWMYVPNNPVPGGCAVPDSDRPRRVGLLLPNDWGFYDMLGNTWQWTCTPCVPHSEIFGETKEVTDPVLPTYGPGRRIYAKGGFGYRYGVSASSSWGSNAGGDKFGNNRNCSRIGGFRAAMDASQAIAAKVDDAWRKKVRKLRIANLLDGGEYALTKMEGRRCDDGDPEWAIQYFQMAIDLDRDCQPARDGLRRIRDELIPWMRKQPTKDAKQAAQRDARCKALMEEVQKAISETTK